MFTSDEEIFEKISETLYWYDCEECDFQTEDYLKAFYHKAKTEHIYRIRDVDLRYLERLLLRDRPEPALR